MAHPLDDDQSCAPGMLSAVSTPHATRHQRVGIAVDHQRRHAHRAERCLAAARGEDRRELARNPGRVEPARDSSARPARGRAPRPGKAAGAQHLPGLRIALDVVLGLVAGVGLSSTAIASGVGGGRPGSPVVAMIEVSVRSRSGCSIAIVCAIAPPIEAPTT